MVSKVITSILCGIEGRLCDVEAFITRGIPSFDIVGLAGISVKESRDRVKAALITSGYTIPAAKIIVNLSPADLKKEGTNFDLPVAVAIIAESRQENLYDLDNTLILGELSLNGELVGINGVLPMAISAMQKGISNIIVPYQNKKELECLMDINVYPAASLNEVIAHLTGKKKIEKLEYKEYSSILNSTTYKNDLSLLKGQHMARFALEVAAAGGHNMIMVGTPGSGKTMLARCLPSILPPMTYEEALETTKIYSTAGMMENGLGLVCERPFRSPHHTASAAAIIGGGRLAKPGEISLAHNGVLFFDEFPEYDRKLIESLRQPIEDGIVHISRVGARESYPANVMLIASMNPCPCGNYGSKTKKCTCTQNQIHNYLNKISGPMLDRIDIQVEMDSVGVEDINSEKLSESSEKVRERVKRARQIQNERYKDTNIFCNAQLSGEYINKYCSIDDKCQKLLNIAVEKLGLSLRAYTRALKVARTIADLAQRNNISADDIAKALQFRNLEGRYWN